MMHVLTGRRSSKKQGAKEAVTPCQQHDGVATIAALWALSGLTHSKRRAVNVFLAAFSSSRAFTFCLVCIQTTFADNKIPRYIRASWSASNTPLHVVLNSQVPAGPQKRGALACGSQVHSG